MKLRVVTYFGGAALIFIGAAIAAYSLFAGMVPKEGFSSELPTMGVLLMLAGCSFALIGILL